MPEWKDTVNLPRTDFPMKAGLPKSEPETLARWDAMGLYGKIQAARHGRPRFVLHDGPPYANGNIHIGTALNKILKDFVVKSRSMAGYLAPYEPGYDCHGLPIELKVDRELGRKKRDMSVADFCRACRAYAEQFVGTMSAQFQRLGILGNWDDPYLTMDFRYQAAIARALGAFVAQGLVYKGKKPVHWCIHCRTALAEAEVEYSDHTSPSIYVEFPLSTDSEAALAERVPGLARQRVSVLIWTTTPWTIPSNLAVAFHPEFDYAGYAVDGRIVILAEALAPTVAQIVGRTFDEPVARMKGALLEGLRFRHPLYERDSLGVLADYVTLDTGTGAVHTAPGHGADDFVTGAKYGLEVYAPIGPGGHFLDTVELFGGQRVFDANPAVEEALTTRGRLWHRQSFSHQYPHCWRCHNPVIFLATSQWFIRLDGEPAVQAGVGPDGRGPKTLRAAAIEAIDHQVQWIPAWGHDRIYNMVANRPDWCISRQRAWGVPIPAVDCTKCGEAILTTALVDKAARVFETYGADAWYERPLEEFVPAGLTCPSCGGTSFEREMNILDVWFDSGSSHEAVLSVRPELSWPADLYLEGSDQHRGWFQSSLLVGLGTRGRPPFAQVVTHGFIVASDGKKMSKSLGNTIEPGDIIKDSGADILRLWIAMSDFTQEIRISKEIVARASEAYRKIRNTLRYLLANLYDFDPVVDAVPVARLEEIDRYILGRYAELGQRIVTAYANYDYATVFQGLNAFTTVDLSSLYVDVSKDRLYTYGTTSGPRRSAQTAMYIMVDGLTRLMAPILPFTADELWRFLPGGVGSAEAAAPAGGTREESVHIATFPQQAELTALVDADLAARWTALLAVRERVLADIEPLRKDKQIGSSLQARVALAVGSADAAVLERSAEELAALFIVSDVAVTRAPGADTTVVIERAPGTKCERCWRYVPSVATDPAWAGLCGRCEQALSPVAQTA